MDKIDFNGGFVKSDIMTTPDNLSKDRVYDAGLDIRSAKDVVLVPGERVLVPTGLYLEIFPGYMGLIWARSGMAFKHGVIVGAGCIDATYRGEVKVLLFNLGHECVSILKGDRIAQLLTVPVNLGMYIPVEYLSGTERGEDGFGSSGK